MTKTTITLFAGMVCLLVSCSKDQKNGSAQPPVEAPVQMHYIFLQDRIVKYGQPSVPIDFNHDGRKDMIFGVLPVGDPVFQQDKFQFLSTSDLYTLLPVNAAEQIPVLNNGDAIPIGGFSSYNWYGASSIVLVQKVIPMHGNIFWEGPWKTAVRKYLPFQLVKNNLRYNGYVELTVEPVNERVVLHKAAISVLPEKTVYAGG